jgi:hypothetical protein
MTVRSLSTIAIACIVVTSSAGGNGGTAAAQPGPPSASMSSLRVTPISVPEGTLRVYLPDDIAAGDTITGTVVAEPAGNTDEQRSHNTSVLEGYVVSVGATPVKPDRYGRVFLAAGLAAPMYMVARSSKGAEVRRISVPIQPQQPTFPRATLPNDFHFPQVVAGGQPFAIHGPFSGDFQNTTLAVGGQPVQKLAQSPRTFIAAPAPNVTGPTSYQLNERGVAVTAPCNVISLKLTAPKMRLTRGEHTTIHIAVTGLEGIRAPVPLVLENSTPGVVTLTGGQVQVLTIAPSDVAPGPYGADRDVTGIGPGGFSISATIDEHNRATVDGTPITPHGGTTTTLPVVPSQPPTPKATATPLSVSIEQLDVGRPGDAVYIPASEWGRLRMSYVGSARVLYLNLTVNRRWVMQNVRVLSEHGANQEQAVAVAFGLGNKRGVRVDHVDYGITLWARVSVAPPPTAGTIAVKPATLDELCTGGGPKPELPVPKGPIVGGQSDAKDGKHTNDGGFPNQEAPYMGCVPTGFSNSLQWLKKNNDSMSGVNDADISIDELGKAVGFIKGKGTPDGFIQKKIAYLKKKGIPVDTVGTDAAGVGKQMDNKCDVEIWTGAHFAAVVGISKGQNGKYSIDVAHDTDQRHVGGTTTETVTYDPKTNKIKGGTWMDGTDLHTFVIECPKKKKK